MRHLFGEDPMRTLRSEVPPKHRLSAEWHRALQLLANNPRGTTEDMLVLGHGISSDVLGMLVLAGLTTVETETLRAHGSTIKVRRMHITDTGRRAIRN
jgi:hypothetical protein